MLAVVAEAHTIHLPDSMQKSNTIASRTDASTRGARVSKGKEVWVIDGVWNGGIVGTIETTPLHKNAIVRDDEQTQQSGGNVEKVRIYLLCIRFT